MTLSAKTLTAIAVLTNPLTWLFVAVALLYCVFYVAYLYCKHEFSIPEGRVRFQPPFTIEPQWPSCIDTAATLKPGDKCGTSGTAEVVTTAPVGVPPLLNVSALAIGGAEQMTEAAKSTHESVAQVGGSKVVKTPQKRCGKRNKAKKKPAAKTPRLSRD